MNFTSCYMQVLGCLSIMEDAGKQKRSSKEGPIQETGQEVRPARMVGYSSLDSAKSGKDAGYNDCAYLLWRRGER